MKLKDPLLLRELCFIDGAWAPADNGGGIDVHNPATAEKLGVIPNMGADECRRAIAAAAAALPAWAARTAKERAGALRRWFDLILVHQDDLATLVRPRGERTKEAVSVRKPSSRAAVLPARRRDVRLVRNIIW